MTEPQAAAKSFGTAHLAATNEEIQAYAVFRKICEEAIDKVPIGV
mgnify:CR=1 FL=1